MTVLRANTMISSGRIGRFWGSRAVWHLSLPGPAVAQGVTAVRGLLARSLHDSISL
jgi:hypothetical protein